jgi:NAD(P)-dependent dehydrogenase (short-subunit alcohol dehydrogenase family)
MKNYVVIGASSGIGKELTQILIEAGHKVYGTYCTNKVESDSSLASYFYFDATNEDFSLDELPETVDGLVYCPGSIALKPFARIKTSDFESDFQLQVLGAIKVIQQVLPLLKKSNQASVVLFSTVAAQLGLSYHSQVSVSKSALEGLTRSLAAEFAPHIRVNCIAPSLVETPLAASLLNTEAKIEANNQRHPLKRIGTARDIANMAEFLLSEKSSWLTGQILHVDGGISSIK